MIENFEAYIDSLGPLTDEELDREIDDIIDERMGKTKGEDDEI